jgi:hypothetical protein
MMSQTRRGRRDGRQMEIALMMKPNAGAVCVIGAIAVLMATFGTGVASADDPYVGKTYGAVSAVLAKNNADAIITVRVGNALPDDQCVITHSQLSTKVPQDRLTPRPRPAVLFALNCYAGVASAGTSGNSAASPEGRAAQSAQEVADFINAHPEACTASAKAASDCKSFCDAHATLCKAGAA